MAVMGVVDTFEQFHCYELLTLFNQHKNLCLHVEAAFASNILHFIFCYVYAVAVA